MDYLYETHPDDAKQLKFWTQCGGQTLPHYHQYIELIYVMRGEATIAAHLPALHEGELAFIPSLAIHSVVLQKGGHYLVTHVSNFYIPECKRLLDGSTFAITVLPDDANQSLRRMFELTLDAYAPTGVFSDVYRNDEEKLEQCRLLAASLVSAVLLRCRKLGLVQPDCEIVPRMNTLVVEAVNYIHEHYRKKLLLTDIARALYCNAQQLSVQFRKSMHMSVGDYISSLRTLEVYRLIGEHPELPLSEMAELVGFQSMRSMLRAFRTHYGCTPSAMKRGEE